MKDVVKYKGTRKQGRIGGIIPALIMCVFVCDFFVIFLGS